MNHYSLRSFHTLQDTTLFWEFCQRAALDTAQSAHVNMWGNVEQSLPYILKNTTRFNGTAGEFSILYHNDDIVACAGVYQSEFSRHIALAGTRLWIDKDYRNSMLAKEYILPAHKQWSKERGIKQVAICFNKYNKNLMKTFSRSRLGESKQRMFERQPRHLFHSNINEIPFAVNIQDTPQWVLYESLDTNWNFDWSKIRCF